MRKRGPARAAERTARGNADRTAETEPSKADRTPELTSAEKSAGVFFCNAAELAEYLAQGCVFLPASSSCYVSGSEVAGWNDGGSYGGYWSSNGDSENLAYYLIFDIEGGIGVETYHKFHCHFPCRLVRE